MPQANKKNTLSFEKLHNVFFFSIIIILLTGVIYIFKPFFYPIFWAAIIAIMFSPLHRIIKRKITIPGISSLFMLIIVFFSLIIPLLTLSALLANQSFQIYATVSERDLSQDIASVSKKISGTPIAPYIKKAEAEWPKHITTITQKSTNYLFKAITSITQNSAKFLFMFFIMFYTLYYFFKDGSKILKKLMHLSPLGDKYELMLYEKFNSMARATMKSTLIIGGIQGFIGGVMFWIAGVNNALIWGVIMALFSIIPAFGPFMIWLPAGIIMLALGNIWQGIFILIIGAGLISTIDNLLRPPLIGKDTEMHPLLVLFSTIGGILIFGVSGFIIGPIITTLFMSIMSIYDHYYENELTKN
jgi:predicted PurR-regulated permease PerM